MKKILLAGCLALSAQAFSQTVVFSDDFEAGNANWTLNQGNSAAGNNQWVVNLSYNGNAGQSIPNVPAQPGTFVNGPNSAYMHINFWPDCSGFVPVSCNAHFNPGDSSNQFAEMTTDISTLNSANVTFSFWYLCGGEQNESYGNVEYSLDGGISWNTVGPELYNTYDWTQVSISDPAFDNQSSLRFLFHWRNTAIGTNPALAVDEVTITTEHLSTDGITMQHMNASTYCPGAAETVGFEALGTFNAGNVFTAQLSDASGSFATPTDIGTLSSIATGIQSMPVTFPTTVTAGTGYRVRVISSDVAMTGGDNGDDLTFLALPTISVTTNPASGTICIGNAATLTAAGATTYTWAPAGTLNSASGTTVTATPQVTTTYTVTGTEFEGCTNTQQVTVTVDDCAGIGENTVAQLGIYPNPAADMIQVQFAVNAKVSLIEIVDQAGRVVRSINWNEQDYGLDMMIVDVNVSGLEAGSYIVRLTHAAGNEAARFTKK